jgi:hypothetical protein
MVLDVEGSKGLVLTFVRCVCVCVCVCVRERERERERERTGSCNCGAMDSETGGQSRNSVKTGHGGTYL